ncbi:hemerythrin domain-containing protein [Salinicola aestuarinus]|uniref:hemerythrin domain-containing protein n=1 Tax=Salinicola aestuarinus TaxID=1949082 RepID=UPI000DA24C79|nr:hemerythrin domain-containing protein [Salinicola aestuarinus]
MLTQLRQDHANMARLLHVLQLKYKTLADGDRPNFRLIREVVDYILDYMNGFTVPLERICSDQLAGKAPEAESLSERLTQDYQHLHEQLMRLSQDIDMILMDGVMPMDKFAEDLKSYLGSHRAYLRAEREKLFPLIREHFDEDDLKKLASEMPENAESELARLQEAYPELYTEFRDAPSPLSS